MIPRKIHFIWIGGEAVISAVAAFVLWWRRLVPDYELVVWDWLHAYIMRVGKSFGETNMWLAGMLARKFGME